MIKNLGKKIAKLAGLDVRRRSTTFENYSALYKRYENYTMIPRDVFVLNLELCDAFRHITGEYVECGVWRGGMSAAIAEVLGRNRRIHLFDSFEGLPPAKEVDGVEALQWQKNTESHNYFDNCTADEKFAMQAMTMARHENYMLHKGWFNNSLPGSIRHPVAILRLDGDWYDSIIVCLEQLFPWVTEGGIILLDDYYTWDGCAKAVHDYLSRVNSPSRIHQWNNQVAYIIKKS